MRRNFSMSGSAGRGELGPGDKACSCWGPHLCCPHRCCSPGTGSGRCSWLNFAVWWKDPDKKTSTLTCFAFTACLWRGVKMWKPHTLYFNEKPKREVKLFHFENTRKILFCHPSTSILSVQTICLIWREICLKRIYTPIDLLFIKKCHSLQVCILQASFLWLPGQAEQMQLCEARGPRALPVSCWKWARSWGMTTGTLL